MVSGSLLRASNAWHYSTNVDIYLIDGTYELFRHFFAVPSFKGLHGQEIGAVRGVLNSVKGMIDHGATHLGVATDHVIESFRNDLYAGYKTGEGIPPELYSQFPILEAALEAMGVVVWAMVEFEADDALASAALKAAQDTAVERVVICTPDKDLSQCVSGTRIVQLLRRTNTTLDEPAIVAKFGVGPESIPDYLALVGDSADGFPGVPVGERKLRPQRYPITHTLKRYQEIGEIGFLQYAMRVRSRRASSAIGKTRCFSAPWQRCAPTCRFSTRLKNFVGMVRGQTSRISMPGKKFGV